MSSSIEQLLSKSLEDLYEELGRSLIAPEFPKTATMTGQNAAQRGRSFVSGSLERLRANICAVGRYCNKRSESGGFQSIAYTVVPVVARVLRVLDITAMLAAV